MTYQIYITSFMDDTKQYTNSSIVEEEFTYHDALCTSETQILGDFEASTVSFTGIGKKFELGDYFSVNINEYNNDGTLKEVHKLGSWFIVDKVKKNINDTYYYEGHDILKEVISGDFTSWYVSFFDDENTIKTVRTFLNSFLIELSDRIPVPNGVIAEIDLPEGFSSFSMIDDCDLSKVVDGSYGLSGKKILQSIFEAHCRYPKFTWNSASESGELLKFTLDAYYSFSTRGMGALNYKDYDGTFLDGYWESDAREECYEYIIRKNNEVVYASDNADTKNHYIIDDNLVLLGMSETDVNKFKTRFTSNYIDVLGSSCDSIGEFTTPGIVKLSGACHCQSVIIESGSGYMPSLERTIQGIQGVKTTLRGYCTLTYEDDVNSAESDIRTLKGKYNTFSEAVEDMFEVGEDEEEFSEIDDSNVSDETTFSSAKLKELIQRGRIDAVSIPTNSYVDVSSTFEVQMTSKPTVVTNIVSASGTSGGYADCEVVISNLTRSGFSARIFNASSGARTVTVDWIATSI